MMKPAVIAAGMLVGAFSPMIASAQVAPTIVVDSFDSPNQWSIRPAEGVEISIHQDTGLHGASMRLDFDFHGHGGYAVVHRKVDIALPANYEFSFSIRGDAPVNTLEFKLLDSTGDNVWWSNQPNFAFPREWRTVTRKKRQITFAWGPMGGGEMHRVAALEFAITAGTGGKGTVWIDDLMVTPLDPDVQYNLTPHITSSPGSYDIDFLKRREFGGLVIDWDPARRPLAYDVLGSADGQSWQTLYAVNRAPGATRAAGSQPRDYLYLPETDARYVRISLARGAVAWDDIPGIREVSVKPIDWARSENEFFERIASDAPRGSYPKYFSREQSYWTVVGLDRDSAEALIDEQGMVETGRAQFSIEPFLFSNGKLFTWNDVTTSAIPHPEALPLPTVRWRSADLELTVAPFATGTLDRSILITRYRVKNRTATRRRVTLFLAVRPFQVNPSWQSLNMVGGVARIDSIVLAGTDIRVNGNYHVIPLTAPSGFGAATFDDGNIVDQLRRGQLPAATVVHDRVGRASAALAYTLDLAPGATSRAIDIAVPLHGEAGSRTLPPASSNLSTRSSTSSGAESWVAERQREAAAGWREKLGLVSVELPPQESRYTETLRANLGYILINRDGPAIQPGSRSYSRSWIRDGALTSTALLRAGHAADVREYIEWYAPFQYENGKVPCCVDWRGADPVPENDSHGELIYVIAEYYRHTGDRALLERMWPHVLKAVNYMDSLRQTRMTEEYRSGDNRVFFGLLTPSISHEGYSKPMHSYWDDFFALRGFKDAEFIASELRRPEAMRFGEIRDSFRANLYESIRRAMRQHRIDYIPGSAELGDFDATSTTIAVAPVGELGKLPREALDRTFDKYFENARARSNGTLPWKDYTPYELRSVGTFVQLGQRRRAHEMLDFFFRDQRPAAWYHWAEVVYRDPKNPGYIGDMPHTWVGSDYIRSFLDMLAYERESDSSLVIGAGVPERWVREAPGVRVANLSTHYGRLSYEMRATGNVVTVRILSGVRLPPGGIVIASPLDKPIRRASAGGQPVRSTASEVRLRAAPATVTIRY